MLVGNMPSNLRRAKFEPPLIDTFALITRSGAKLSKPIAELVEHFTTHLVSLVENQDSSSR
jgi:hypothetical protein